jgi:hypothetical protein
MTEQTLREIIAPIYYSLLSLYDRDAERESIALLKDALSTGEIRDRVAKNILQSIVDASADAA